MAGPSIVAIATIKSDRVDNSGLTMDVHGPGDTGPMYVPGMWRCASMGISIQEGESQVPPLYRFQKMMQMNGILREAKSLRHFFGRN
jgi:hypothetical protein